MSLWQTQSWQEMLKKSGQVEEYFVVDGIFVEKRKVSFGEYGLFVIGFDVASFSGKERELGRELKHLCKAQNCLFIQIETIDYSPPTLLHGREENLQPLSLEKGENSRESFVSKYYKKFIPPYTALIDLTKSEEEILADMKQKGRYNIRLAEKKGVTTHIAEKTQENIAIFYQLMQETNSRDNFAGNRQEYYEIFLQEIPNAELIFAQHEEDILAAGIFVFHGEIAYYYYGASTHHKKNLMAPYALQWRAIQEAKKRGCKLYNFLGVAGPNEKNSSLAGVTQFKKKLSPHIYKVSEPSLYIHKKWKYCCIIYIKKIHSYIFGFFQR